MAATVPAEVREGTADAEHGDWGRGFGFAVSQRADWRSVFQTMSAGRTSRAAAVANQQLLREREVRGIVDTVLRIAKSIGVAETEVHVDESISALTRFANNAIHQNVAERTVNVSVRTQVDQRTARATTNR